MNEWYSGESTVNPVLIDTNSSKRYVYVRRNVEQRERIDEMTGEIETYYSFEEYKIPKNVYSIFEKQRSDIDYIAMMTDIDLEGG